MGVCWLRSAFQGWMRGDTRPPGSLRQSCTTPSGESVQCTSPFSLSYVFLSPTRFSPLGREIVLRVAVPCFSRTGPKTKPSHVRRLTSGVSMRSYGPCDVQPCSSRLRPTRDLLAGRSDAPDGEWRSGQERVRQAHTGARLADVQLIVATWAEAYATARERYHPGVAADGHSSLRERIEPREEAQKDHARVMLLAPNKLANRPAKARPAGQD